MSENVLKAFLCTLINYYANKYSIDPSIVKAIIYQESARGANTIIDAIVATRYEHGFFKKYIENKPLTGFVPGVSEANERRARAFSWGLMQVMGATAREHGLQTQYITSLLLPWINLEIGCRYFAKLFEQEKDIRKALIRYNGSESYADSVIGHIESEAYESFFA